jgi:hypothetical protein
MDQAKKPEDHPIVAGLRKALAAAGAEPEDVVSWNLLVLEAGLPVWYAAFQRVWGDRPNPPVITAAVVTGLAHPHFFIEMDAGSFLTGDSENLGAGRVETRGTYSPDPRADDRLSFKQHE